MIEATRVKNRREPTPRSSRTIGGADHRPELPIGLVASRCTSGHYALAVRKGSRPWQVLGRFLATRRLGGSRVVRRLFECRAEPASDSAWEKRYDRAAGTIGYVSDSGPYGPEETYAVHDLQPLNRAE